MKNVKKLLFVMLMAFVPFVSAACGSNNGTAYYAPVDNNLAYVAVTPESESEISPWLIGCCSLPVDYVRAAFIAEGLVLSERRSANNLLSFTHGTGQAQERVSVRWHHNNSSEDDIKDLYASIIAAGDREVFVDCNVSVVGPSHLVNIYRNLMAYGQEYFATRFATGAASTLVACCGLTVDQVRAAFLAEGFEVVFDGDAIDADHVLRFRRETGSSLELIAMAWHHDEAALSYAYEFFAQQKSESTEELHSLFDCNVSVLGSPSAVDIYRNLMEGGNF